MYKAEGIVIVWFYCCKSKCSKSYTNPWCSASKPLEVCNNGSTESWQPLSQVSHCRVVLIKPGAPNLFSEMPLAVLSLFSRHLKHQHNQHLESFLRSVDEKDSLRAWYYSAIICQVSGLQSLCYSEELAALDVCMNPFTSTFMLWWWSFPFGTKNLLWSVFDQAQQMPLRCCCFVWMQV